MDQDQTGVSLGQSLAKAVTVADPSLAAWLTKALFAVGWVLIGLVSLYDMYLVIAYKSTILQMEENPICLELIRWDPVGLSYFLLAKFLGTAVVLTVLLALYARNRRLAMPVIGGVAAFQIGLLMYMTLATATS